MNNVLHIKKETELEFREIYGFTFVVKTKFIFHKDSPAYSEIKVIGIIYDENDEYYFAPLYDDVNINEVVEEFVKKSLR